MALRSSVHPGRGQPRDRHQQSPCPRGGDCEAEPGGQGEGFLSHPVSGVLVPGSERGSCPHPGVGPRSLWQQVPRLLPAAVPFLPPAKALCEGVAGPPPCAAAAPAAPRDRHAPPAPAPTQPGPAGTAPGPAPSTQHPAPCWGGDAVPEPPLCQRSSEHTCGAHSPAPRRVSPSQHRGHPGCSMVGRSTAVPMPCHAMPCRGCPRATRRGLQLRAAANPPAERVKIAAGSGKRRSPPQPPSAGTGESGSLRPPAEPRWGLGAGHGREAGGAGCYRRRGGWGSMGGRGQG